MKSCLGCFGLVVFLIVLIFGGAYYLGGEEDQAEKKPAQFQGSG